MTVSGCKSVTKWKGADEFERLTEEDGDDDGDHSGTASTCVIWKKNSFSTDKNESRVKLSSTFKVYQDRHYHVNFLHTRKDATRCGTSSQRMSRRDDVLCCQLTYSFLEKEWLRELKQHVFRERFIGL